MTPRRYSLFSFAAVPTIALTLALASPAIQNAHADTTPGDSSDLTGSVLMPDGITPANGAIVDIKAEPSNGYGDGSQPAQLTDLSSAVANADGTFTAHVSRANVQQYLALPASSSISDPSKINVVVEAGTAAGDLTVYSTTYNVTNATTGDGYFDQPVDSAEQASLPTDAAAGNGVSSTTTYASLKNLKTISGWSATSTGNGVVLTLQTPTSSEKAARVSPSDAPADPSASPDYSQIIKNLGPRHHLISQGYSTTGSGGFTYQVTYANGSSSKVGIGVSLSATGDAGTFKVSGTENVTKNSSSYTSFPKFSGVGRHYYRSDFVWSVVKQYNATSRRYYTVSGPTSYAGGAYDQPLSSGTPAYGDCEPYPAGSVFVKNSNHAVDWTNAVSVESPVSLSFQSQTGYTTQTSVRIAFTRNHVVCGSNGYPGGSGAYILEVRG